MTDEIPEHPLKTRRGEPVTFLEAISEALFEEMTRDDDVFLMGEDIGVYGGAFKVTRDFLDHFGESRVIDSVGGSYTLHGRTDTHAFIHDGLDLTILELEIKFDGLVDPARPIGNPGLRSPVHRHRG